MNHEPADDGTVGRVLVRREVLALLGGSAGAAIVSAYVPDLLSGRFRRRGPFGTAAAVAAAPCVVRPEQTEGPYFVDERLNRSDIRSDPGNGAVKDGVPLAITFAVQAVDGRSCVPLAGVVVDIWHCDALGVYSDVQDPGFNTVGQKFLRGYQVTDANGAANFVTIYPGWYQGRTVHVHFKLRTDPGAAQGFEFTSQLYFDDALTDVVHAQQPYAAKGQRTLRNSGDGIYRNGGSQLLLAPTADGTGGYRATFDIALEGASVPPTPTPIAAACSTIETCLADLQSVLPDPLAASSRKARSATRRLQRQALGVARRLARAAGSSGAAQVLEYLRARAALQRLLVLAQAADAKGALDVPLSQVESAVAALFDQLPS
ncbi:MAG TPA: intradiol ring-cleavage dioxygenase [Candidatus Margulisiibacteriota bacterium]|nr:intradiol ring-cleavage dioxygenase [Candidatus Margulisiibacteriota bacterium]